jgi:hypothetical protein
MPEASQRRSRCVERSDTTGKICKNAHPGRGGSHRLARGIFAAIASKGRRLVDTFEKIVRLINAA